MKTILKYDGATANNPAPDWWDAQAIKVTDGGVLFHERYDGGVLKRRILHTEADVVDAVTACAGDDDELEQALALLAA